MNPKNFFAVLGLTMAIVAGITIANQIKQQTPTPAKAAVSYSVREFVTGLVDPSLMNFDSNGDLYVTQRGYDTNGVAKVFKISPSGSVSIFKDNIQTHQGAERGLLGVEVDNQYVYIYYTKPGGATNAVARIDKNSKTLQDILTGIPAGGNHNAGSLHFGGDGKLYISTGNSGVRDLSSDINTLAGKILRINTDGSIPSDNPFVGKSGEDAIWAYGLRNPFTFNIDDASGKIFVNDVGDGSWEEINELTKGGNYGYPTCEGKCSMSGLIDPIYQFPNPSNESAAITGGAFWKNGYFFGDFKQTDPGWIDRYDLSTKTVTRAIASVPEPFAMDVSPNGKLYLLSGTGIVYEVTDNDTGSNPTPTKPIPSSTPMVQNNAPVAQINTPTSGTTFTAGQTISFSGTATDPEDGTLAASKLSWDIRLYHVSADPHNHPFQVFNGVSSGSFTIPNQDTEIDSDIWYNISLKATDSKGLTTTASRDIYPKKSQVTFATQPTGLTVLWDSQTKNTPYTETNVEGMRRNLSVASPQVVDGKTYRFSNWSDGGTQSRVLTIPTNDTIYTAIFTEVIGATPMPTTRPTNSPQPTTPPSNTTSLGNTQTANPIKLDNTNHNILHGIQIRPAQTTTISTGNVYLGNVQSGTNVGLAIYSNTSSNTPGNLIAQSTSKMTVAGWNQVSLNTTLSANTTYWLVTNNNANSPFSNNLSFTSLPTGLGCVYGAMPYNYDGTFPTNFTNNRAIPCSMFFSMYVSSTSTPQPTTPPTSSSTTISFDSAPLGTLTEYPTGISWQENTFAIVSAWGQFGTRNLSLKKDATQGTIFFDKSANIASVEAYNGGTVSSTVTVTCGSQSTYITLSPNTRTKITTNFSQSCLTGTLRSSNGWDTNFDNLVIIQ